LERSVNQKSPHFVPFLGEVTKVCTGAWKYYEILGPKGEFRQCFLGPAVAIHCFGNTMKYGSTKLYVLTLLLIFSQVCRGETRVQMSNSASAGANKGSEHAHEEEGKEKDAMQMLMALAQAAQAAAMAAAAAGNKKSAEKATASEPVKVPEIPNASTPPQPSSSPEFKLPESAESTPIPEIEIPENSPAAVAQNYEFPAPSSSTVVDERLPARQSAPESSVPETINDRAKLGYDEKNPSGGNNTNSTPNAPTGGLAGAALSSGAGAMASLKAAGETPETKKERFAKNVTDPEGGAGDGESSSTSGGAYGSGGGGEEGSKPDNSNMSDLLAQMMGGGAAGGAPAMGGSSHGDGMSNGTPGGSGAQAAGKQRETIFEYAAFRYRKLAYEEKAIKRDGRKKPSMGGVLSQAHDIFSSAVR